MDSELREKGGGKRQANKRKEAGRHPTWEIPGEAVMITREISCFFSHEFACTPDSVTESVLLLFPACVVSWWRRC